MPVSELRAKTILNPVRQPDAFYGVDYTINPYRGCQHGCLYCDTRSACYGILDLSDIQVKVNAPELLARHLQGRRQGVVCTGSMSDPYMPLEAERQMTRRCLQAIARCGFPVHVITKSDLVLRDIDLLREIRNNAYSAVSITITTADPDLAAFLEPGAPPPARRFEVVRALTEAGILTGVSLSPVIPYLTDSEEGLQAVIRLARQCCAHYVLWYELTMRDNQAQYFLGALEKRFPAEARAIGRLYGGAYTPPPGYRNHLKTVMERVLRTEPICTSVPRFQPPPGCGGEQLSLF